MEIRNDIASISRDDFVAQILLWAPTIGGLFLTISDQNLNLERASFIAFLPIILYSSAKRLLTRSVAPPSIAILFLAMWNFSLIISSIFSPSPHPHLEGWILCAMPTIIAFYIATKPNIADLYDNSSVKIVLFLSLGGICSFYVAPYLPENLSNLVVGNLSNKDSVKFLLLEPNIFGSTLTFFLLSSIHILRTSAVGKFIFLLACTAIYLSFSRGPYAALVFGLFIYFLTSGSFRNPVTLFKLTFIVFFSLIFILLFWEMFVSLFEPTLGRRGTLITRSIVNSFALDRFSQSPLVGLGPLDFPQSMGFVATLVGTTDARSVSISQMFIGILHDSGLIGFLLYSIFIIITFIHGAIHCIRDNTNRYASYLSGFSALLLASQATAIYYTPIFGICAGLLLSRSYNYTDS